MGLTLLPALAVTAALLVLAGVAKLRRPQAAEGALYALGLPVPGAAVRLLGVGEVALGAGCLLAPGRLVAAALAAVYLGFAAAVVRLRAARVSCGCFGEDGPPAGSVHLGLNLVAALVAAGAAVAGPQAVPALLDRPALEVFGTALGVGGATYAGYLAFTALPGLWDAWLASESA